MNISHRSLATFLTVLVVLSFSFTALADETEDRAAALAAVRAAAAGRDLAGLKAKLEAAAKLKGEAKYDAEYERLEELSDLLQQFWQAVDKGARKIQGDFELMVGDKLVAVVEFDGTTLILRVSGENKRYNLANIPPRLALTLSEQVLDKENGTNKAIWGTFLLLDGKGERKLARQYFEDAKARKVDVARFLPEFDNEPAAPAIAIEIPPLAQPHRLALSPQNWQVRIVGGPPGKKGEIDKALTQNEEGRLAVKLPTENIPADGRLQVSPRRTFAGNFAFQTILTDVKPGQTFCFGSPDPAEAGYTVKLPTGTIRVELARVTGKLVCRINGKEMELAEHGKPKPALSGAISITAAPGGEFGVAIVEWSVR